MGNRVGRILVPFAILAAVGAVAVTAYVAAATMVARTVVTPARRRKQDVDILSVAPDLSAVTVSGTADALAVPGRYGLWFSDDRGYALLGDVIAEAEDGTVTRAVESVRWGALDEARRGRLGGWFFTSPAELGLPVESVDIVVDDGTAPAWLFPAAETSDRWAIHVHGRGARRQETLRAIPLFHEKGYTSLAISYRNDGDAPDSADHRYGLGATEWHDVDAAIAYALASGAKDILLVGWSMGGAIALQTAVRSPRADSIRGLVLDSPVIDWVETLDFQADEMRLPRPVTEGALLLLDSAWATSLVGQDAPIGLAGLDFTLRAHELSVPVLLMHSDDDGYVPAGGSHRLAHLRPDIVTFVPFAQAKHTKLWNYDPVRWTNAIADWLDELSADLGAVNDEDTSYSARGEDR
ncbi:alpha/beta fold hydrolase [Planctomonas sp. JC2975]|uniref:alpha/beta fold hydrolase n=1 Tax=Planctomonas sp. JC2975 TaxID=2729626 RepID=UPI001472F411|nr:alpha/beta fold hydrolase [Planctomonas sp. JC2975]